MALFRVYENGKPAHIEHYLKWSAQGAERDELVFVTGHPGSTSRQLTTAGLKVVRDVFNPEVISFLEKFEKLDLAYAKLGDEQKRQVNHRG